MIQRDRVDAKPERGVTSHSAYDAESLRRTLDRALRPDPRGANVLLEEAWRLSDEPAAHRALLDVARRFRGTAFGLEPVLVEMVAAVLRGVVGESVANSPTLKRASRAAAEMLHEDPACRARSEALWARLVEDAA